MKKFLSIYQELNSTSHLWSNWGHTPDSLFALNGEEKEAAYADDFLEKRRKQKENLPHIELPENCIVPTDDEIQKLKDEFNKYWENNGNEPAWHKNGDRVLSRIMKDVKANINGSCAVYHDKKNGTVLLFSSNEDLFDKAFAKLEQYFDQKHCDTIKFSMPLASVIKNSKYEKMIIKFEAGF